MSSFASRLALYHCLSLPLWPCKVQRPSLSWFNNFSLFNSLLISSYNHLLARLEDQISEKIEVYTLFSVNYFISLAFLIGHFKRCISHWIFYKQPPTLFSRDNISEEELCDFQLVTRSSCSNRPTLLVHSQPRQPSQGSGCRKTVPRPI